MWTKQRPGLHAGEMGSHGKFQAGEVGAKGERRLARPQLVAGMSPRPPALPSSRL